MLTQAEIAAIHGTDIYDDCIEHSGVKGMHWYERRYQYPDGRLTPLGRIHYGIGQRREAKKIKIMQSGNAKKILKYQKNLTDAEFEQAMARVAKSEALKKVADAPKEAKKAEKAAKDAAKAAEKVQSDKVKLSEKELKNAKDIAKAQAKTKNSKVAGAGSLLAKGAAAAVAIAGAYKKYQDVAKMISELTGAKMPGVNKTTIFDMLGGKKDDKKDGGSDDPKKPPTGGGGSSDGGPKPPPPGGSGSSSTKKKPEESTSSSSSSTDYDWGDFAKAAADFASSFSKTSTSSSEFKEYISPGVSVEGKGKSRDKGFFSSDTIFGGDWDDISSTPTSEIDSFLPAEYKKWWLD